MLALAIIFSFLAGLILANGIPHFVKGITGQYHATPFAKPSTPVANVWWAWANFVVGIIFWHIAHPWIYPRIDRGLLLLGALVTSVMLSNLWTKHPEQNIKK